MRNLCVVEKYANVISECCVNLKGFFIKRGHTLTLSVFCFKSGNKRFYSSLVNKKSNYVLFKEIKNVLANNPFNNDTQKKKLKNYVLTTIY